MANDRAYPSSAGVSGPMPAAGLSPQPGKRTLTESLPMIAPVQRKAAEAGPPPVSAKLSVPRTLKEIKIPKKTIGYFEVGAEVKFTVDTTLEPTKAETKEGEAHAEGELTVSPDAIEAEVKKKYASLGSGVSVEGSLGDSFNWKERKFEVGAGLKLVSEGDIITSEAGAKLIPFTIDDDGVHLGELAFEGKGTLNKATTIAIGGSTFSCKPSASWKASVELNKERISEELFKNIAERVGMTAAGDALIPAAVIAAGALAVFMYFDTILAADDLQRLVDAGPPAVARARQFIAQAMLDIQSGNGPAVQQMAQHLGRDFGGAIPPGMLARALREKVQPEQLKAVLWAPMRRQIIDRAVADYRAKHKVESAFKDMTSWVGDKLGAEDDHRSTYGEDILFRTLNEILPTAL
jgi:hypothetical protein